MRAPNGLGPRQEIRLRHPFGGSRHDFGDDLVLLRHLDFLTRCNPTENLGPLLRHPLNTGRFHFWNMPRRRPDGKAAIEDSPGMQSPGAALDLGLSAQISRNYEIQATADFVDWTTLTNLLTTNLTTIFTDPSATNFNQRFYRGIIP